MWIVYFWVGIVLIEVGGFDFFALMVAVLIQMIKAIALCESVIVEGSKL